MSTTCKINSVTCASCCECGCDYGCHCDSKFIDDCDCDVEGNEHSCDHNCEQLLKRALRISKMTAVFMSLLVAQALAL